MQITKRYIYPPRPVHDPVPFDKIGMFRRYGWKCQIKVNDLRTEFSIENGRVEFFTRHATPHKRDIPDYIPAEILKVCEKLGFGTSEWVYLDGGLLQHKNKHLSGLVAIWDILVVKGDYLLGTTYQSRYDLLAKSCEPFIVIINGKSFDIGLKLTEHIFVPRIYNDFDAAWSLVREVNTAAGWSEKTGGEPCLEGLVMKQMDAKLEPDLGREKNNNSWSARSRVCTKRHHF